jgi:putative CocE/NonD family hydrolase
MSIFVSGTFSGRWSFLFVFTLVLLVFQGKALGTTATGNGAATTIPFNSNPSVYVDMPDGIRIALEIMLPEDLDPSARIPTLISFTRYWRASAYEPPQTTRSEVYAGLNQAGYAVIKVDARGSGASFGSRETEFSTCETRDFKHVIDWVAAQPWSNGRVATIGVSYSGNTAESASYDPSPALRATVPRFTDFDGYAFMLFPGGLRNSIISDDWSKSVMALDSNTIPVGWKGDDNKGPRLLGVKPVDADQDGTMLAKAVSQHEANTDVMAQINNAESRDDLRLAHSLADPCAAAVTPYRFRKSVESSAIPAFHWASWVDAGTAAGVIARFASYKSPGQYVIGPWTHGARLDANLFMPEDTPLTPDFAEQYGQILDFLKPYMFEEGREPANKAEVSRELAYFTMGENAWKTTTVWPPEHMVEKHWYLSDGNGLNLRASQDGQAADTYQVNFQAGSGTKTRWTTQLGGTDVFYGDRQAADELLLSYTSAPLDNDTEISGHPVVDLYLSSSHEDGAIIAYLEAVDPEGVVTMITEGQLRLIHRKVSQDDPPYPVFGPYHSYLQKDVQPMVPGEVTRVSFVMLPTSVLIPAGHRLRLAIAGHDKDSFSRYPQEGTPELMIRRNSIHASKITIPMSR